MISVIVVNYNGKHYLRKCLDSLYKADGQKEIIVIDNGSTDGSRRFLYKEKLIKNIKFYDFYLNEGLSNAYNKGASMAIGEWLFFLNNDTYVNKDILIELNKKTSYYNLIGCRMYNYDGSKELDSALSVDRFGYPCGKTHRIFYPDGAIFIKKELFNKLGGFDDKMFLYGEDRDLCWRALIMGNVCGYSDTAIFYHDSTSVVSNKNNKTNSFETNYFRRRLSEQNLIRSILKNYHWLSLLCIIPQYVFLSILEWIFLIIIGNAKILWKSYLPAYWWNVINLKNTIKKRKIVQKNRYFPDSIIRCFMSKKIGKLFVLETIGIPKFIKKTR